MSKKFSLIALAIIAVLGSLVAFATSNLFFTDVPYFGPNIMDTALFASFTALLFGAYFVMGPMYIVRSYLKPNIRKRMSKPLRPWRRSRKNSAALSRFSRAISRGT